MAEKVANKKVPTLMAATLPGSQMAKGPKDQMMLKLRMKKLKDQIVREATIRENQMHDREEELALTAALNCLECEAGGDPGETEIAIDKVCGILQERLGHLERRASQAAATNREFEESSSDEDEAEGEVESKGEGTSDAIAAAQDLTSEAYWQELVEGSGLKINYSLDAPETDPLSGEAEYQEELAERGFLSLGGLLPKEIAERAREIILRLDGAGWPPIFAFMYDQPWQLVNGAWAYAEQILGGPCVLEPSLAAFHLNYRKDRAKEHYMGTNFGLPHRDYTYSASTFRDGSPKILSVWIPLNEVTTSNGCMYVVPREFDGNFDKDGSYEHLQVQTEGGLKGQQFLHFPLNGIMPLPGKAGSLVCWFGNTIHWGSSCHSTMADDPRSSIALVFRRKDSVQDFDQPCLEREAMVRAITTRDVRKRIDFIKNALGYFEHWYKVPESLAATLRAASNLGE